jgi:hypothetical protein
MPTLTPVDRDPYADFRRSENIEDVRDQGWLPWLGKFATAQSPLDKMGRDLMWAFQHPMTFNPDTSRPLPAEKTDDPMAVAAGYNRIGNPWLEATRLEMDRTPGGEQTITPEDLERIRAMNR